MSTEKITLTDHLLGLRPYFLLEYKQGDEGPDDLRAVVEFGGGPESTEDAVSMLWLFLTTVENGMRPLTEIFDALESDPLGDPNSQAGVEYAIERIREDLGMEPSGGEGQ